MAKFVLDNVVVEVHAMGHKNATFRNVEDVIRYDIDGRCIAHRVVIDSRKSGDKVGYLTLGVYQRSKLVDNVMAIIFKDGNFRDLVSL